VFEVVSEVVCVVFVLCDFDVELVLLVELVVMMLVCGDEDFWLLFVVDGFEIDFGLCCE